MICWPDKKKIDKPIDSNHRVSINQCKLYFTETYPNCYPPVNEYPGNNKSPFSDNVSRVFHFSGYAVRAPQLIFM